MAKKGRPNKTESVLRNMKSRPEPRTPIATEAYIPNLSGVKGADDKIKIRGFTDGSVLFCDGGKISEDNGNFFWDDTNNILKLHSGNTHFVDATNGLTIKGENGLIEFRSTNAGNNTVMRSYSAGGYTFNITTTNTGINMSTSNSLPLTFDPNGSEIMRATTTGLIIGGTSIDSSAILQQDSTTQGFLPPRMTTTQRDNISSPAAGLMIYNSTTNKINFYNGSAWEAVTSA